MSLRLSGWDDTIVALATPPGVGALGIIRLSGNNAIAVVNTLFPSKDLLQQPSHTLHVGLLKRDADLLDEVVVSLYKAPRSYTGEDVVEISCHGSPFIQQRVIDACLQQGVRLAKAGEFTQRAFLNGKLDLTQAEAVADLIASNTKASHKTALHNIRGGFSRALKHLREQLITFSALIELELDFSQEDVEFADRTQFMNLIKEAKALTGNLLQSFQLGNVIKHGVSVAIVGKPNAGKSTLLNALLQEERAIVSEIAGTTRDTIEEVLNIDGILFRLIDTAGIRSHTADIIEVAGMERSLQKIKEADLVLYLFDVNEEDASEVMARQEELEKTANDFMLVGNKVDTGNEAAAREKFSKLSEVLFVSAKTGLYQETLKQQMVEKVLKGNLETEDTIITNARHYQALNKIDEALADIHQGLVSQISGDLLALDIRTALQFLGEITGEVTNDDTLDYIFSKFCIGK